VREEALVAMSIDYLKVTAGRHGQVGVLVVSGELDACSSAMFTEAAEDAKAALRHRSARIIIDLSGLRFIDCGGARALAAVARSGPGAPVVVVRSVRPAVRRVMDLMGVGLELLGPGLDLLNPGPQPPGRTAVMAGTPTGKLVRRVQAARSDAERAIADSRQLAEDLAVTGDRVAVTLAMLASSRPKAFSEVMALSQAARMQAVHMRCRARPASPSP
jgi:anti-anti-sigma factor